MSRLTWKGARCPLAWIVAALSSAACSVADNLSCGEILTELDGIVRIEGSGDEQHIGYAERAPVSAVYMRWALLYPLRGLLAACFGPRHEQELTNPNPAAHVRTLLRELPDETSGDLLSCAQALSRLDWIAELESNAESRVVAIDGLAAIAQQLELAMFDGSLDELGIPAEASQLATARLGLQVGRPDVRGDGVWDETRLRPYLDALVSIVERPLDSPVERVHLVEDLTALFAAEPDAKIRSATAVALRRAMVHAVQGTLLRIVQDRDTRFVELRLCAMEQIRRLGGPRTVPLLLAVMTASPAQKARDESQFDKDSLIQLRLVHYCGQVSGQIATTAVKLPGRRDWDTMSPIDFLVTTVLNQQEYYSKLRTPALAALTWSLQRARLDPDPAWVRQWNDARRP